MAGTSPAREGGGGVRLGEEGGGREFPCGNHESSTCVTLNDSGIQLAVGPQPLRLRNHNFGLAQRIMVKRLATSPHDPLGIIDSACKNQLVVVSVQYGPFNPYIPIISTTIGKSRVAKDPIATRTSSDIASVTRVSMTFRVVRTNQYNQDLGLIHSTNGNHLESPNEGSSIDHQVTIYLHAQNITMFPTNETWYFASQILVSSSGGLILILTAQSTRNVFRIHTGLMETYRVHHAFRFFLISIFYGAHDHRLLLRISSSSSSSSSSTINPFLSSIQLNIDLCVFWMIEPVLRIYFKIYPRYEELHSCTSDYIPCSRNLIMCSLISDLIQSSSGSKQSCFSMLIQLASLVQWRLIEYSFHFCIYFPIEIQAFTDAISESACIRSDIV
ncbi:triacylglycerol lipase [Dorcoceras hygrometricum]|uniref:Triacylglycerol lipase n=1 Tax=Dorcoceras hygrometricum TaxID=472368 RepID=A0A2Z7C8R8_9LAMI|nr:triacylglycerol lipase [Dorcoceras hygrometricum]